MKIMRVYYKKIPHKLNFFLLFFYIFYIRHVVRSRLYIEILTYLQKKNYQQKKKPQKFNNKVNFDDVHGLFFLLQRFC